MKLKLFTIAMAFVMCATALASDGNERKPFVLAPAEVTTFKSGESDHLIAPRRENSDEQEIEVTIKVTLGLDYVPMMGYPLKVYNNEVSRSYSIDANVDGDFEGVISIPAGTYDFMFMADHVDKKHQNNSDRNAIVVRENVEVNAPITLEFNPEEATNHIAFKSYLHEGELAKQRTEQYIDNKNTEVVEEGNLNSIAFINEIIHSQYNMIDYNAQSSSRIIVPSEAKDIRNEGMQVYDFWVNNVSDKYEFRQIRQIIKKDGTTDIVILSQYGADKELIEVCNDYNDYFNVKIDVANTPISENYEPMAGTTPYTFHVGGTLLGGEVPGLTQGANSSNPNILSTWVSPGTSTAENPKAVVYWKTIAYETETTYYNLATPYLYLTGKDKSVFANFAQDNYVYGENGREYGKYYAGHPGLAIEYDKIDIAFQESTPFCLMSFAEQFNFSGEGRTLGFNSQSYGQMGELRGADQVLSSVTIHYNGEEVLQGMDPSWEWPMKWGESQHEPGEYVFKVVNENVKIDGIKGKNEAEMVLDQKNADFYPPAMQMIQTRNKDGRVAIRFGKPEEGQLRIVGGDFNPIIYYPYEGEDWFNLWYKMDKADLKVEYAANGSNEFFELKNIETSDQTYWGFNDMYLVPLDEVAVESDNKWYDLRITFTDEAGNYQKQILSPAFRIESVETSGISQISYTGCVNYSNGIVSVSGIDNPTITVFDSTGKVIDSTSGYYLKVNESLKGVYIIKVIGSNGMNTLKICK